MLGTVPSAMQSKFPAITAKEIPRRLLSFCFTDETHRKRRLSCDHKLGGSRVAAKRAV
jgi:hypothetical protein